MNNKIQYVVVYAHTVVPGKTSVPLILKNKPEHLKGMLNLPGGKLNEGEDPVVGALRELKEETGLDEICECDIGSEYVGRLEGTTCIIHAVKVPVVFEELKPGPDETEEVNWYSIPELYGIPNLMPNLRVMIPLLEKGVKGWVIQDFDGNWRKKMYHEVTLFADELKYINWNPWLVKVRSVGYYTQEEEE